MAGLDMDTLGHPLFATKISQIGSQSMKDKFMALYLVSNTGYGTRYCDFQQVDRITIHATMNYEQRS